MRRNAVVLFLFGLLSVNSLSVSAVPGTTDGAFEVSPTGAATYNIPIKIVPGISGMQPQLSVNYSSQGGLGNLGIGFSLSGFSQITRCKATIATEGYTGGIDSDVTDSFCLDGQKLIPTDPSVAKYAAGECLNGGTPAHYSTEIESFSRIVSCGVQGNGPQYFLVWTKSGLKMEYGVSEDSRLQTRALMASDDTAEEQQQANTVLVWGQNKVTDTKGNYYKIGYFKRLVSKKTWFGQQRTPASEYYPDYIEYTGNDSASLSPNRIIKLSYTPYANNPSKYFAGTRTSAGGVINTISSYANASKTIETDGKASVNGRLVRQYNFGYKPDGSLSSGHELLTSVEECGVDANSVRTCLDPTHFEWTDEKISFSDGDNTSASGVDAYSAKVGDYNGDGITDLAYLPALGSNAGWGWQMLLGGGARDSGGFQSSVVSTGLSPVNSSWVISTDYDGDGNKDFLVPNCSEYSIELDTHGEFGFNSPGNFKCVGDNYSTHDVSAGLNYILLKYSDGGFSKIDTKFPAPTIANVDADSGDYTNNLEIAKPYTGDFDGDGLEDLVYPTGGNAYSVGGYGTDSTEGVRRVDENTLYFIRNGAGTSLTDKLIDTESSPLISNVSAVKAVLDLNGDRRDDIVIDELLGGGCKVYYSTSKANEATFTFRVEDMPGVACGSGSKLRYLDLNSDGFVDILATSFSGATNATDYTAYINTGAGFKTFTKRFVEEPEPGAIVVDYARGVYENFAYSYALDYNADGRVDLIIPNNQYANTPIFGQVDESVCGTVEYQGRWAIDCAANTDDTWLVLEFFEPADSIYQQGELTLKDTGVTHGDDKPRFIADFTGDGRPDIVRPTGSSFQTFINSPDATQPQDMVGTITTGLDAQYRITYKPLTATWYRSNPDPLLQTGTYQKLKDADYPRYRDFVAPMYVVSHVSSDVGGTDDGTIYRYSGAKIDTHGRGLLGFRETEAIHFYIGDSIEYISGPFGIQLPVHTFTKKQKQRMVNFYHQNFPLTGKLEKSELYSSANQLAAETINDWTFRINRVFEATTSTSTFGNPFLDWVTNLTRTILTGGPLRLHTRQPYLNSSVQNKYWQSSNGSSHALESSVLTEYFSTDTDIYPFDRFGNVEGVQQTVTGNTTGFTEGATDPYLANGDFTNSTQTTTTNTYENHTTEDKWYLGRLTSSTVTRSGVHASQASITRTSTFTYNLTTNGQDGLLDCETANEGDSLSVKTCYEYDPYGHKKITTTTGYDGGYDDNGVAGSTPPTTRTTTVEYFAEVTSPNDLQYKIKTSNGLNHTQIDTIDATNGQVIVSQGPNKNIPPTRFEYDALGRQTRKIAPDGTYVRTTYDRTCNTVSDILCDSAEIKFITTKQTFGDPAKGGGSLPRTITYYDKLLREITTTSSQFNVDVNDRVCKTNIYKTVGLHAGRINSVTQPYSCALGALPVVPVLAERIRYQYDVNGNTSQITYPNGRIETYAETAITPLGKKTVSTVLRAGLNGQSTQQKISYIDVTGKPVKVIDNNGEAVRYVRNAYGTVVRTEHIGSDNVIRADETVIANYDNMGNRISLNDPDMGFWEYRYNAFGELKWQKDAKGQVKRLIYDSIGRVETKTEFDYQVGSEVATLWKYDEGYNAIGKPVSVCKLLTEADCASETTNGEVYTYDDFGRAKSTTVKIEGSPYTSSIDNYDKFGRANIKSYPASGGTTIRVEDVYNPNGYLESVRDPDSNDPAYWTADTVNIFGQITLEIFGNNIQSEKKYNPDSHLIWKIKTGPQGSYQNYEYDFDTLGNLERRYDNNERIGTTAGITELYTYDSLNRLTWVNRNGVPDYREIRYKPNGNIEYKSDVGHYTYGEYGAGPHAVTTVSGVPRSTSSGGVQAGDANADQRRDGHDVDMVADIVMQRTGAPAGGQPECNGSAPIDVKDVLCATDNAISGGYAGDKRYVYDANGNMERGDGKIIKYTAFNKPYEIRNSNGHLEFEYDANNSRMVQRTYSLSGMRETHYVGKYFSRMVDKDGNVKYLNYIYAAGKLVAIKSIQETSTSSVESTSFVHLDYLGSIDVVTNEDAEVVEKYAYDPFGKRRDYVWSENNSVVITDVVANLSPVGDRGYTGHEMLDNVGLIHMNGRVYDPAIGRFLSSDPFVQAPSNLQSFNRYTYVYNNPFAYTDPSGYILRRIWRNHVRPFIQKYDNLALNVGVAYVVGMGTGDLGPWGRFATGFALGTVRGEDFKDALISGLVDWTNANTGDWYKYNIAKKAILNGFISGIGNAMKGGSFFEGYVSAFAATGISAVSSGNFTNSTISRYAMAVIAGGISSQASGGNFANGAMSAAFRQMYHDIEVKNTPPKDHTLVIVAHLSHTNKYGVTEDDHDSTGHAFVILIDNEGIETAVGYWPAKMPLPLSEAILGADGVLKNEKTDGYYQEFVEGKGTNAFKTFGITADEYNLAMDYVQQLRSIPGSYNLPFNMCGSFASDIANFAGRSTNVLYSSPRNLIEKFNASPPQ